jgi:hypothetical protein
MYLTKRVVQILSVIMLTLPAGAYADSWSCRHDNNVREVHVVRPTSASVPCDVVYKKQTEGVEDQVLWHADNDEAYCDEKARGFVAKLESWGWTCVETVSETAGDTAAASDQ